MSFNFMVESAPRGSESHEADPEADLDPAADLEAAADPARSADQASADQSADRDADPEADPDLCPVAHARCHGSLSTAVASVHPTASVTMPV